MAIEKSGTIRITEAGRERVASPEFAEELRTLIVQCRASGKSEEEGKPFIIAKVALALASLEGIEPDMGTEFAKYANGNAEEIDAAIGQCLKTLMIDDYGPSSQSIN